MTDNTDLDTMFVQAREVKPTPDLMARVLADANVVQEQIKPVPTKAARPGFARVWWTSVVEATGGWSAVSGIAAAGVVGLMVGLYAPGTVSVWAEDDSAFNDYDLAPDMGSFWTEDDDV